MEGGLGVGEPSSSTSVLTIMVVMTSKGCSLRMLGLGVEK